MSVPANELDTVRDWLRWSVTRFAEAKLAFGHGTQDAWDEAAYLVTHALSLPLDRLVQLDVGDGQRRLVGEGGHQRDLLVAEGPDGRALHDQHAGRLAVSHEGHPEQRPEPVNLLHLVLPVFVVSENVGNLYRPPLERYPTHK